MSRLRRLVVSNRYFFVTCNLLRTRSPLNGDQFEILARVVGRRREEHGFLLTAWVFLPDHWHAIIGTRHPLTISRVLETLKVSSTRQINTQCGDSGQLWQGRFFDRALRTVKEYAETVEYIHLNPMRRGLVQRPEDWKWSSIHEYPIAGLPEARQQVPLQIDRVSMPSDEKTRI
jgi:putative transposase